MLHLVTPLVLGLIIESLIEGLYVQFGLPEYIRFSPSSWWDFYRNYSIQRPLLLFAGVFGTYVLVMLVVISRETNHKMDFGNLEFLQEILDGSKSYIGISIIPIEEWFEPAMQVYLAKIFNRKLEPDDFEHERTLLFFSDAEQKRTKMPLTDEHYYGGCLAHMHKDCGIPLSYLKREEVFKILQEMSEEDKLALCCYPAWTGWRPLRPFRRLPLRWLRWRLMSLDIAIVEMKNDDEKKHGHGKLVLPISKRETEVHIGDPLTGKDAEPYLRFLEKIKKVIHSKELRVLKAKYDFVKIYYPQFGSNKPHTSAPPAAGLKPAGASGNGGDKPSAQVESEPSTLWESGTEEESRAVADEKDGAYHSPELIPSDPPAGAAPSKASSKRSRRGRSQSAPPGT